MSQENCLDSLKIRIDQEYEHPRLGSDQLLWVRQMADLIKTCPDAHKELRLRMPPFKRLTEEAVPISYFVNQHAKFNNMQVTLRKGNQSFDAEVDVGGSIEYIEVVNAEDGHLFNVTAKVLNKFGVAPGVLSSRIPYLKTILKSESMPQWFGDIISGTEVFQSCRDRVLEEIAKKIKHGYGPNFHLVAAFNLDTQLNEMSEISSAVKAAKLALDSFSSIHLFERRSAKLEQVFP